MKNRIHFSFRIDMWTDDGENIIEHLAGAEDFQVAQPLGGSSLGASPLR